MKVLHIDDSKEIRDLYVEMFQTDNHSITSISSGKKGLEMVTDSDYDLILLDIIMPDYDGIDFLIDLKKKKPSMLKKVVVVSEMRFEQDKIKELLSFGIHSVEGKPHNLKTIIEMQKNMVFK